MPRLDIQVMCYKCNGVGIYYRETEQGVETIDPCPVCNGDKYLTTTYLDVTALKNKLDSIEDKIDTLLGG